MNLNTSTAVNIQNGVGELEFPQALKRDLLMSTIYCQSLYFSGNTSASNKGLFVVCDGSYYITRNGVAKKNILAMFQNKTATCCKQQNYQKKILLPKNLMKKIEIQVFSQTETTTTCRNLENTSWEIREITFSHK